MNSQDKKNHIIVRDSEIESNQQEFKQEYPISEENKKHLLTVVLNELANYVIEHYYELSQITLKKYIADHLIKEIKKDSLEHNLFWWILFHSAKIDQDNNFIDEFLVAQPKYHNNSFIISWLKEWEKAIPKFYYVGYKESDRVLVLVDIITNEMIDVIVHDPFAVAPKKGEVVMGTLIPIGNNVCFPIVDFYHFNLEASQYIFKHLHFYYEKHLKERTLLEAFIHVLSIALQIEKIIENESLKVK